MEGACSNEMGYLGEEEEHRGEEYITVARGVSFGACGKRKECFSIRTQAVEGQIQGTWEHTAGHIAQPGCGQEVYTGPDECIQVSWDKRVGLEKRAFRGRVQ